MADGDTHYRAFISYSHSDRLVAEWLHRALESYRIPSRLVGQETAVGPVPRRLSPIFRDRDELPASASLSAELTAALARSAFLIVICSPAAAQSHWVNEEVRQFKLLHGAQRVLALVADGDPGVAGGGHCFPPALRFNVLADGAIGMEPAEPIAADIRPHGDGKRLAKLKLVAGLTGLPLDALVQREAQRRQRWLGWLAAGALILSLVLGVLTLLAVRGQREAERQRAEADGLVEYMLTDLREKLEPVGRLEVLDGVGRQALAYYGRQDLGGLDADALGRRARALHMVGEVRDLRGDSEGALKAFREAERTTAEQLARDPENPERMFDHAQSVFWVGNVAWQRNDAATAERSFVAYDELARRMIEVEPGNAKWQAERGYASANLGILYLKRERFADATASFRSAKTVALAHAAKSPADISRKFELAQTHAWLADALAGDWRLAEASAERLSELALLGEILAEDARHGEARAAFVNAQGQLADLHLIRGEVEPAMQRGATSMLAARALLAEDPANNLWRDIAVAASNRQAEALLLAGKVREARAVNDWALEHATMLLTKDPANWVWRFNRHMDARWIEIAIAHAQDDPAQARKLTAAFFRDHPWIAPAAGEQMAGRSNWLMLLAMAGLDHAASGRAQAAETSFAAARSLITEQPRPREWAIANALAERHPSFPVPQKSAGAAQAVRYDPAAIFDSIERK